MEAFGEGEDLGERADGENLHAEKREDHAEDHGVNVEHHMGSNLARARQQPEDQKQTERHERRARQQKKPIRRIEQHEAEVAPAVAKAAQMRRGAAVLRPQRDGSFGYMRSYLR